MIATITAFRSSPDEGKGQARDMRVRWALEEVGQPYEVRLFTFDQLKQPAYLALQPFGQIPAYEEQGIVLFETGAIVFHIAQQHPGLLPCEAKGRAQAVSWLFAALSTIEPPILDLEWAGYVEADKPWYTERMPLINDLVRKRFAQLSVRLGKAEWLDGAFTAGDLMMVMVLRRLKGSELLEEFPNLVAYVQRGEERPAFQRAYAAQAEVFEQSLDK